MLEAGLLDLESGSDHNIGFAIPRWGGEGDCRVFNTWHDANMLQSSVFHVDDGDSNPPRLISLAPERIVACGWELRI